MKTILFVCTGNVFRSLVAECALKTLVGSAGPYLVGSAGTAAQPQAVHPLVLDCLRARGADPSGHVPRPLTRELLDAADLPVAMGLDHQDFIRRHFGRNVPLFNEVCCRRAEPVLDVSEAVPNWQTDPATARAHVLSVIEHIWTAMPDFLARVPRL